MGEELGRPQDLAVVELPERLLGQADLGDLEAGKMGAHLRQARQHGDGGRLEHRVGRGREHPKPRSLCHLHHHLLRRGAAATGASEPGVMRAAP
jgi:hypothetical protein